MEQFDVYTYNIPEVSGEGKSIPTPPSKTKQFDKLAEAQRYAVQYKDEFDRVVLIQTVDTNQRLIDRYIDGEHILPDPRGESVSA